MDFTVVLRASDGNVQSEAFDESFTAVVVVGGALQITASGGLPWVTYGPAAWLKLDYRDQE